MSSSFYYCLFRRSTREIAFIVTVGGTCDRGRGGGLCRRAYVCRDHVQRRSVTGDWSVRATGLLIELQRGNNETATTADEKRLPTEHSTLGAVHTHTHTHTYTHNSRNMTSTVRNRRVHIRTTHTPSRCTAT